MPPVGPQRGGQHRQHVLVSTPVAGQVPCWRGERLIWLQVHGCQVAPSFLGSGPCYLRDEELLRETFYQGADPSQRAQRQPSLQ
jgi:hypothetical protein